MALTPFAVEAREAIASHRAELDDVLRRYDAHNPRLFGSVARGDATANSDIDVIVDLSPMSGNVLMRLSGLSEEFGRVLGLRV
ncbi:MAG: nucleotidyltransferase family protein, partial [Actinomycetales bacterium]